MLGEFVAKNPEDRHLAEHMNALKNAFEQDNQAAILQAMSYSFCGIPFATTLEQKNGKVVMEVHRLDDPPHSSPGA